MSTRLTSSVRRHITNDWLSGLPGFSEYESLHIVRRVGPILQGVVLERTSGNDAYRPTTHVHSLMRVSSVVTMTLAHRLKSERTGGPDSVTVAGHAMRFPNVCDSLKRQSPLALFGDLTLSGLLTAYRLFSARPGTHYDAHLLYEDMASAAAWCGMGELADAIVVEGCDVISKWPQEIVRQIGGVESWRARTVTTISDRDALGHVIQDELDKFRLSTLPVSALVGC